MIHQIENDRLCESGRFLFVLLLLQGSPSNILTKRKFMQLLIIVFVKLFGPLISYPGVINRYRLRDTP
jgi:hypothetical protein